MKMNRELYEQYDMVVGFKLTGIRMGNGQISALNYKSVSDNTSRITMTVEEFEEYQVKEFYETVQEVVDKIADEVDELVPNNNVGLYYDTKIGANFGCYNWDYDDNGAICNEHIRMSPMVVFNERQIRFLDYFNDTFGLSLKYDTKTARVITFLHEVGHMVDYHSKDNVEDYNNKNQELKAQLSELKTQEARDYYYRQIPEEKVADEFAVRMLVKYYPEIAYAC